jgi:LysM repeat protein
MLSALLALAIAIQPGDTMSGIAASHGISLAALEAANPQVGNPNMIFAGQSLHLPGGGGGHSAPPRHAAARGGTYGVT